MSIKYRLLPFENEEEGKTVYRLSVERGEKISVYTHLVPELAEHLNLAENQIRRLFDALGQRLADHLAQGNSVQFDHLFVLRPGLTGQFDSPEARLASGYEGLRLNFSVEDALFNRMARDARYEFMPSDFARQPLIERVMEVSRRQNDVYTPGRMLQLRGRHLKFELYLPDGVTENPEQGVFWAGQDEQWQRLAVYSETSDKRITLLIPPDITANAIKLKVCVGGKSEVIQETVYPRWVKKLALPEKTVEPVKLDEAAQPNLSVAA